MKIQLTKSKSSRDRYYLVSGSMGNYGTAANHANNSFEIEANVSEVSIGKVAIGNKKKQRKWKKY